MPGPRRRRCRLTIRATSDIRFQTRQRFIRETFTSRGGAFTLGGGVRTSVGDRVTLGLDARVGWEPLFESTGSWVYDSDRERYAARSGGSAARNPPYPTHVLLLISHRT